MEGKGKGQKKETKREVKREWTRETERGEEKLPLREKGEREREKRELKLDAEDPLASVDGGESGLVLSLKGTEQTITCTTSFSWIEHCCTSCSFRMVCIPETTEYTFFSGAKHALRDCISIKESSMNVNHTHISTCIYTWTYKHANTYTYKHAHTHILIHIMCRPTWLNSFIFLFCLTQSLIIHSFNLSGTQREILLRLFPKSQD